MDTQQAFNTKSQAIISAGGGGIHGNGNGNGNGNGSSIDAPLAKATDNVATVRPDSGGGNTAAAGNGGGGNTEAPLGKGAGKSDVATVRPFTVSIFRESFDEIEKMLAQNIMAAVEETEEYQIALASRFITQNQLV